MLSNSQNKPSDSLHIDFFYVLRVMLYSQAIALAIEVLVQCDRLARGRGVYFLVQDWECYPNILLDKVRLRDITLQGSSHYTN